MRSRLTKHVIHGPSEITEGPPSHRCLVKGAYPFRTNNRVYKGLSPSCMKHCQSHFKKLACNCMLGVSFLCDTSWHANRQNVGVEYRRIHRGDDMNHVQQKPTSVRLVRNRSRSPRTRYRTRRRHALGDDEVNEMKSSQQDASCIGTTQK
jgi:hypothetical protein